jgi:hypothetical protein
MTHRKNLGFGLGRGYKNLISKDPFVHSMSARGVKQKIPIESVTINWKEGKQNYEKYPMTFKSVAEANKKILSNSFDAPASGGYDKHSFTINWKDGNVYEGRMDVKHPSQENADLDMKKHVEDFANYIIKKPKTEFPRYSKEDRKYARDLLKKYSLDAKGKKFETRNKEDIESEFYRIGEMVRQQGDIDCITELVPKSVYKNYRRGDDIDYIIDAIPLKTKLKFIQNWHKDGGNEKEIKKWNNLSLDARNEDKPFMFNEGKEWIVIYANQTKAQTFPNKDRARNFLKQVEIHHPEDEISYSELYGKDAYFYQRLDAAHKQMFHIIDKDGEFEMNYDKKDLLNYANELNDQQGLRRKKAKTIDEAKDILEGDFNISVETLNAKGTNYKKQLKIGTQVEMEHTKDRKVAKKIAQTHLKENKDYYAFFDSKDKKGKEYLITMHQLHAKKRKLTGREIYNKGDPYFYEPVECRTNEDEYYDNDMYAKGKKPLTFLQKIGVEDMPHRGRPEKVYKTKLLFGWNVDPQELNRLNIARILKTKTKKEYRYTKREKKIGFETLAGGGLGYSLGLLAGGMMGGWAGFPIGAITGNIFARVTTKERGRKPAYQPSLFRRLLNPREDILEERRKVNLIERARLKTERMAQ